MGVLPSQGMQRGSFVKDGVVFKFHLTSGSSERTLSDATGGPGSTGKAEQTRPS
jgi:hypothetical protein